MKKTDWYMRRLWLWLSYLLCVAPLEKSMRNTGINRHAAVGNIQTIQQFPWWNIITTLPCFRSRAATFQQVHILYFPWNEVQGQHEAFELSGTGLQETSQEDLMSSRWKTGDATIWNQFYYQLWKAHEDEDQLKDGVEESEVNTSFILILRVKH